MKMMDDFEIIEHNPHTASPEERYRYKQNIHPHGSIPAMITSEGEVMLESAAICLYLAKIYGMCLPDEQNEAVYYKYVCHPTELSEDQHSNLKFLPLLYKT